MSIISITRGTKSGGLELARRLSQKLGYKALGREEVISDSTRKFSGMEEFLEGRLDKMPSFWQRLTHEYERYICFVRCALLQAVKQDNVIYHGHAGQFLLKGLPSLLKLRVHAPFEYRVRAVMAELQYTRPQAAEYIKQVDEERKRWVKQVYNQNWCDPTLYDLCVNLQNMSMDTICDVVATAVEHPEFKSSEETTRRLNNVALQCAVRATLWSDDRIWNDSHRLAISAHDGVVSLRGTAKSEELRDLIVDTASGVKGVLECKSEIQLFSDAETQERWGRELGCTRDIGL